MLPKFKLTVLNVKLHALYIHTKLYLKDKKIIDDYPVSIIIKGFVAIYRLRILILLILIFITIYFIMKK